jgi:hypothetical protein
LQCILVAVDFPLDVVSPFFLSRAQIMYCLSVAAFVSALSTGGTTYAEAYRQAGETGRPMVVLVGADWCPACQTMKQSIMPQAQRQGMLSRVAYAEVNTDREGTLSRQLMRQSLIPQLIIYHQTADGWRRRELIGSQALGSVESLIQEALQAQPSVPASPASSAR